MLVGAEAAEALTAALEEADDLGHPVVGPGHLLLGLARTPALAAALAEAGVDVTRLRATLPRPDAGGGPIAPSLHVVLRVARTAPGDGPLRARGLLAALMRAGGPEFEEALAGAGVTRRALEDVAEEPAAARRVTAEVEAPAGFSAAAAAVLARARELAEGHGLLHPEHLLVALLFEARGLLLAHMGAVADPDLRAEWLEERFAGQGRPGEPVPLAALAADALAQALVEAAEAGNDEVEPAHVLLGLLAAAPEAASRALFDAETLLAAVRESVR